MSLLGVDLGGTKLALAVFQQEGNLLHRENVLLEGRKGKAVASLICEEILKQLDTQKTAGDPVQAIGISVPGISYEKTGLVWAPNIPEWDNYPLLADVRQAVGDLPVKIDSDRACAVLGEVWKGNTPTCENAIFLTVGTGIGAGILADGRILRGAHDISGCIGWMALQKPYQDIYDSCGCFEYYASGDGIARTANVLLEKRPDYQGPLRGKDPLSAYEVFRAFDQGDALAKEVLDICVELWGMASANLISLFNPEKIIFGGGVFGPAVPLIPAIKQEAEKWAQPIGMQQVTFEASVLGGDACLMGAAFLAKSR
jgi:glucokinase